MKRRALVIERERVTRPLNADIERAIRQFQRPDPFADAARHLVDGKSVGRDRVPDAEEFDLVDPLVLRFVVANAEYPEQEIAEKAEQRFDAPYRVKLLGTIGAIRH